MKHRQVNRKMSLSLLGALFLVIALTAFGCSGIEPATRYANKTARPVEYPAWRKAQKKPNKDWRIGVAEKQVKAYNLKKERAEKEAEILNQVEQIKSQIGNE